MTDATGPPCTMRKRSSAVSRAGSGASGAASARARTKAAIATGKVARIAAGALSSGRAARASRTPSTSATRPRLRSSQSPQRGEGRRPPGAEPGAHLGTAQPRAGEAFPQQTGRRLRSRNRRRVRRACDRAPRDTGAAIAVAQHLLGSDQSGEPAIHPAPLPISPEITTRGQSMGAVASQRPAALPAVRDT